jgi:hypothetical protein
MTRIDREPTIHLVMTKIIQTTTVTDIATFIIGITFSSRTPRKRAAVFAHPCLGIGTPPKG